MLADIETEALEAALESLHDFGPNVRGVTCDVADRVSVARAAEASYEAFGNVACGLQQCRCRWRQRH